MPPNAVISSRYTFVPRIKKNNNKNNIRNETEISNVICECFFKLPFTFLELK